MNRQAGRISTLGREVTAAEAARLKQLVANAEVRELDEASGGLFEREDLFHGDVELTGYQ